MDGAEHAGTSAGEVYDEHYYATYGSASGVPYERREPWLSFFAGIADRIVETIKPRTVLDAGCAKGFLVEALRDRGVEAFGLDISRYAIGEVRHDITPYCWVASVTDPFPQRYDLILCIEVLEHLPAEAAERAVVNLCHHADDILFSSSPDEEDEATHVNVRPVEYWVERFAEQGFLRDGEFDAGFIARHAVRFQKRTLATLPLIRNYERALWRQTREIVRLGALEQQMAALQRERYLWHRTRVRLEQERMRLMQSRQELEHALLERGRQLDHAARGTEERDVYIASLKGALADLQSGLAWKVLARYRGLKERVAPPGSAPRLVYDRALGVLKRARTPGSSSGDRAAPGTAPAARAYPWGSRLLVVSGSHGDMERYRCHHLREQLALHDIPCEVRALGDPELPGVLSSYDVVVLHRVPYSEYLAGIVRAVRARQALVLFDIDDLVFDPALAGHIHALQTMAVAERAAYVSAMRGYRRTLRLSDAALVSTDHLVEAAARAGKPAWVHRNALSQEMIDLSERAYGDRRPAGERVVIGYASGTRTHHRDFQEVAAVLARILETHPAVELRILGHLDLDDQWTRWGDRIVRVPFVPWRELPAVLAALDVNLAPLEAGNPFCLAKSELKYFEAAVVGVPTVASRMGAFEIAIRHGDNGFLAGTADEWFQALDRLVTDRELRTAMGERARADALARYHPRRRGAELLGALDEIAARVRAGGTSAAMPLDDEPEAPLVPAHTAPGGGTVFPEHALAHEFLDGLTGLEIGPAAHNPFGLQTRNVMLPDGFEFYAEHQRTEMGVEPPPVHIWAPADAIPVPDRSEDFILSSHVVEHLPNLIGAFVEWNRIVRDCGYVFMIVPLKGALEEDGPRELTTLEHFVEDFQTGATLDSHPTDGVPGGRMGHYHTFTPDAILAVVDWMQNEGLCHWQLAAREDVDTKVGNGFTLCFMVIHP